MLDRSEQGRNLDRAIENLFQVEPKGQRRRQGQEQGWPGKEQEEQAGRRKEVYSNVVEDEEEELEDIENLLGDDDDDDMEGVEVKGEEVEEPFHGFLMTADTSSSLLLGGLIMEWEEREEERERGEREEKRKRMGYKKVAAADDSDGSDDLEILVAEWKTVERPLVPAHG